MYGVGMDQYPAALVLQVAIGLDSDPEEIVRVTSQLRRELLDSDIDVVETPSTGEPPPGSKGVNVTALGALFVSIADSQLLAAVVTAVRSWLAGSSRRSIKLQLGDDVLELSGVSSKEQKRLTDEWLARQTTGR